MTTYNRFYIPDELKTSSSELLKTITSLYETVEIIGEMVVDSGDEIGLLEITHKGNAVFNDEIELALHNGRKRNIGTFYISAIEGSSAVVTFQPIFEDTKSFQDLLWDLLFSTYPNGVLMYEGGYFKFK